MKKVITIICSVLAVCLTIGFVVWVLFYTGILGKEVLNQQTVYRYTTSEGLVYTEAEWTWKPVEYRKVISYVNSSNLPSQTVALHLYDNVYYDVAIPDSEYIYDYGKTIWAIDGSYMIRVVGDATMDNLSMLAGLDNGQTLNQVTLCSQDKQKGCKIIVTLVDGYAIIANVYYGDETYSIIRDSLSNGKGSYDFDASSYLNDYILLNDLSYNGRYVGRVVFQEVDLETRKYMFEDGTLWTSCNFDSMLNTRQTYINRLCAASGHKLDEVYQTQSIYYAKSGDYYLGLISYNANTTIVIMGDGEESKCNIISCIRHLR